MAPSLQGLVNFLLNEIALCGDQGATLVDVLKAIDTFYQSPQDPAQRSQTVDRRFQAKVWSWLTRNSEVSVGKNNEWNHLNLDEAEQLDLHVQPPSGADVSEAAQNGPDEASAPSRPRVRVFVSKERTWYAVTGHEPDDSKVFPLEFVLLSIIASRKFEGIPQTELVRLSGQDKRSVPKRTDSLQKKGYIVKRPVQVKAARTSQCTLRRFLYSDQKPEAKTQEDRMIDFEWFTNKLFEILKEFRIIARNDLKKLLGFEDLWRWRILSRALRKFERIGVLKRVRAESQYEKLHPCVMLLRDPTARDLELFQAYGQDFLGHYEREDRAALDEDMDLDTTGKPVPLGADRSAVDIHNKEVVEDAGRTIPSWTPDRILSNQIFDIVNGAGTAGITNLNIIRNCFGSFYRRPLENVLHRLVDCWQVSQPPHLRHFAIVRDTGMDRTVVHYVHYSARNFRTLVEAGQASWEAVEYKAKSSNIQIPPVDIMPQLNQYGFPQDGIPARLLRNGNATLFECIAVCKPADYLRSSSDYMAFKLPDGQYIVRTGHQKLPSGCLQPSRGRLPSALREGSMLKRELSHEPPGLEDSGIVTEESPLLPTYSRRAVAKQERLRGLSKKERYEALGMDESWTEYNALLMERPTPGVYITRRGKRKPAGKARGRPRVSRIAIFKSPKLASLPWFAKEQADSEEDEAEENVMETRLPISETPNPVPSIESEDRQSRQPEVITTPPRRVKRNQSVLDNADTQTASSKTQCERARKQPRLDESQDVTDRMTLACSEEAASEQRGPKTQKYVDMTATEAQGKSAAVHTLDVDETLETPSKRRRLETPTHLKDNLSAGRHRTDASADNIVPVETVPKLAADETGRTVTTTRTQKSGSIGMLRKKIIMEIVEKAGGAYPSGIALWYPFTTEWSKTHRPETPDMRTVKSTVQQLVDAGRLRQLTFSGKDGRGVTVTKTVLRTPELSPDDPVVKEMQKKALSGERQTNISPHVEVSPVISKAGIRFGHTPQRQRFSLPVEPDATVNLQQKPAFAALKEKRHEQKIQRQLLRNLGTETITRQGTGVKRLMKIQRPSAQDSAITTASIPRPHREQPGVRKRGPYKRRQPLEKARHLVKTLSTLRPSVMLMNPGQTFNLSTGTFGTVGVTAIRKRKLAPKQPSGKINELVQLASQTRRPFAEGISDSLHEKFFSTADKILKWELEHEEAFNENFADVPYINQAVHGAFQMAPIAGGIRFEKDERLKALRPVRTPVKTRSTTTRRRQPEAPPTDRRLSKLDSIETAPQRPTARQFFRRQRPARPVSENLARKLMLAIVAVRVLAGGAEAKLVDWYLVTTCFPDHDPKFIEERARLTLSKNRLQVAKMQQDFRERFIDAYARDQVPRIDYANLETYDWATIIEWADAELAAPMSERLPDLPATRQQFDSIFELREEPVTTTDELYQAHLGSVIRKRSLLAQVPFAVSVSDDLRHVGSARKAELARLEVAKSWVRANIMAPEESYRPADAKQALARFADPLRNSAVQSLLTDRVIGMSNHGRINPGRMYDITDHFLQTLSRKRDINSLLLQRAAHFKTSILDPALQSTGVFDVKYNAEDGDILALINLAASGRVELRPRNPPRDKFGLTDGGYMTRQIDKSRLRFVIDVRPLAAYVYGNPIHARVAAVTPPPPPPSEDKALPPKIPVWLDIHGAFVPRLWEKVVAAVLRCVAIRPDINAARISEMIKPTMGAWETLLLLQWLADVGVVRAQGAGEQAGWSVQEWWWMVL